MEPTRPYPEASFCTLFIPIPPTATLELSGTCPSNVLPPMHARHDQVVHIGLRCKEKLHSDLHACQLLCQLLQERNPTKVSVNIVPHPKIN
eukprot:2705615-Amphidinium_carterae.1